MLSSLEGYIRVDARAQGRMNRAAGMWTGAQLGRTTFAAQRCARSSIHVGPPLPTTLCLVLVRSGDHFI